MATPLQSSYLENSRGAWRATVYGAAESQTRLNAHTHGVWSRGKESLPAQEMQKMRV